MIALQNLAVKYIQSNVDDIKTQLLDQKGKNWLENNIKSSKPATVPLTDEKNKSSFVDNINTSKLLSDETKKILDVVQEFR